MGAGQAGGESVCGERVVKDTFISLVIVLIVLCLGTTIVLIQQRYVPEPVEKVVEIAPEDRIDLIGDEDSTTSIVMTAPAMLEPDFVISWPFNADGCPGNVMEVEGTGDLEIECGTLKFEDGKLVEIVGCFEAVVFAATDVWPQGER